MNESDATQSIKSHCKSPTHYTRLPRQETHSPHTYTGAIASAAHFLLHILAGRLLSTPTGSELRMEETHSPPHILVELSMLDNSCREATEHTHNGELQTQEKHSHTHMY